MEEKFQPDAIIIGTGLAGLTAAMEITNAGKKSIASGSGNRAEYRRTGILVIWRIIF